jgi:hypothetical protein
VGTPRIHQPPHTFASLTFRLRDELKNAELRGSSVAELEEEARRLTALLKVR